MTPASDVYLVDGDAPAVQALRTLLRTVGFTPHVFPGGSEFLADHAELPPGCVIAPLRMRGMDSLAFIRRLRAESDGFGVILTANDADISQAVEAMKAGAVDFIQTPCLDEVLVSALRAAARAGAGVALQRASQRREREALARLTPREQDILAGVLAGKTSKVIARECRISPRTVEVHRANVMIKSGARSLSELVRMSLRAGRREPAVFADQPEAA